MVMSRESQKLNLSRDNRLEKVLQQAMTLGLLVKQRGPSLFYFTDSGGSTITQYGLWASEIFLQGYQFATKNTDPPQSLSWVEEDD